MKKLNNKGFSALELILIVVVLGFVVGTGIYFFKHQKKNDQQIPTTQNTQAQSTPNQVNKTEDFVLPAGWKWYENSEYKVKFAYPSAWDKNFGFLNNLGVVNDSEASVGQGCEGPTCQIKYNPSTKKWVGPGSQYEEIKPVKTTSSSETYLIPIKGEMYCGTSGLYIHYSNKFLHSIMSLCTKNDDPNFQPRDGIMLEDTVTQDLVKVMESITELK